MSGHQVWDTGGIQGDDRPPMTAIAQERTNKEAQITQKWTEEYNGAGNSELSNLTTGIPMATNHQEIYSAATSPYSPRTTSLVGRCHSATPVHSRAGSAATSPAKGPAQAGPAREFRVTGAGAKLCNGLYRECGKMNNRPQFKKVNANGQIETVDGNCCQIIYRSGYAARGAWKPGWLIYAPHLDWRNPNPRSTKILYSVASAAEAPPADGWDVAFGEDFGQGPAPSVVAAEPV